MENNYAALCLEMKGFDNVMYMSLSQFLKNEATKNIAMLASGRNANQW